MHHFADWCGTARESFTGHWDVGHRLQLVYGDVLKASPELKKFLKIVDTARGYCQGKDGLALQELSVKLKASFLTEKSDQVTRWVRSLLRLIETYFRNLPIIAKFIGQLIENARKDDDITEQKSLQNALDTITDPFFLAFGIGLVQILDSYAKASLDSQKLWNFPGTIALSINNLSNQLINENNSFIWSDTALQIGSIGVPLIYIQQLQTGTYKPQLTTNMKISAAKQINLYQQLDFSDPQEEACDSFTAQDIVEQDIGCETLNQESKIKCEQVLSDLSSQIKTGLDKRIKISHLIMCCVDSFHNTDWYDSDDVNACEHAEERLNAILACPEMSSCTTTSLLSKDILPGYLAFLEFKCNSRFNNMRLEEIYQQFCDVSSKQSDESVLMKPFMRMFEFVNIKSYSEAYCESVGSLMNILVDKGRNLSAGNFSKELIFAFNAPSIHILSEKFIPEVAKTLVDDKQISYFRGCESSTYNSYFNKLKFSNLSSSLGNYRMKVDSNGHLPLKFFN